MPNWQGYFLKANKTNKKFPLKYIDESSWSATPNSREEIKAYRDENTRNLTRVTATGTKSSFTFSVRPNLHLTDKIAIQEFFTDGESNSLERKISLTYWNDETNSYMTGNFYRPDIQFKIKKASDNDLIYDAFEISLVEY